MLRKRFICEKLRKIEREENFHKNKLSCYLLTRNLCAFISEFYGEEWKLPKHNKLLTKINRYLWKLLLTVKSGLWNKNKTEYTKVHREKAYKLKLRRHEKLLKFKEKCSPLPSRRQLTNNSENKILLRGELKSLE